jgi:hypothetical protein
MYYEYQESSDFFMGKNIGERLKKARKFLRIGALSLIPGVGPIAATAAAVGMIQRRRKARILAAKKRKTAIQKVTESNPVKAKIVEPIPVKAKIKRPVPVIVKKEETAKKKTGVGTWLIYGGLASAAMFLMGN